MLGDLSVRRHRQAQQTWEDLLFILWGTLLESIMACIWTRSPINQILNSGPAFDYGASQAVEAMQCGFCLSMPE